MGASAGGLAALRLLLKEIPEDTGLIFVVVVHLSPEHKSMLADLLQPSVNFPVRQVTETTLLEPNNVYVIPPNANISAIDTHLRLSPLEERRRERAPIDHFFRTLAATHDGHSIGVVLTGTGSDGTLGLREIKAKGGLILVQDPNEAEFDGMPQSAITTGIVDLILPISEIASSLVRFGRTGRPRTPDEKGDELSQPDRLLLPKVLAILKTRTDRDFSRYKTATILRRVARRMQLGYVDDFSRYIEILRDQPEEARALADDLLITVTSFFRDLEVFEKLEREIIPQLFEGKTSNDSLRVWSVGCATGEEAYSIAMLLLEESARRADSPRLQIFASDLHKRSLDGAREGVYPGDIETDVSEDRLRRFFRKESGSYRISKEVRDTVVFAPHNLLADPPFSRLNLIICRNLLIYLDRTVQHDVIELFHYALNSYGFLLLGSAETTDAANLFRTEDKRLCIFQKRNVPAPEPRLPVFPLTRLRLPGEVLASVSSNPVAVMPYSALHQNLLERSAPPSILVGPDNKVVHLSSNAGRYLKHPGGEVTSNLLRLVREELRIELQSLLLTARSKREPVDSKAIVVRFDGRRAPLVMHLSPAQDAEQDGFILVIFEEHQALSDDQATAQLELLGGLPPDLAATRFAELEAEFNASRQRLQATIEEYETSQEEMKAANEEMQSANEELRSTMEELETSKEELQSMNEELQTVNQENRHKVDELSLLSSDLQNLLGATDIATLFLDRELRIMRFTPRVAELFNIRVTDRGRPISDLTHRLGYQQLREDAQAVLERLIPIEHEIQDESGRWFLTRLLPYRSTEDRIEGVVITFINITGRKAAEQALRRSENRFRALATAGSFPVYRMSADWEQMYELEDYNFLSDTAEPSISWFDTYIPSEDLPTVQNAIQKAIHTKSLFELEHRVKRANGSVGWVLSRAVPILDMNDEIVEWFGAGIDVTARKEAEAALKQSERHFRLLVENVQEYALFQIDLEGKVTSWNPGAERLFGYSSDEMLGLSANLLSTEEDRREGLFELELSLAVTGSHGQVARWVRRKDGGRFWAQWTTEPVLDENGQIRGLANVLRDESERKLSEERQALLMAELNHRVKNTLATVQAIANQTLRNSPDPVHFAETFQARLHALSRAHNLLTRRSWESADVAEIIRDQVLIDDKEENILSSGPPALLAPQTAVALSLVLHELMTNARKYGARSTIKGKVHLKWHVKEPGRTLHISWIEIGGPKVHAPDKRGFGTMLIERSLSGVAGSAETRFEVEGLQCFIKVPLASEHDPAIHATSAEA